MLDADGKVVGTARSDFDGFFLFDRVPYGQYRLRLAGAVARKLQVRDALASTIAVSRSNEIARLGVIRLEPGVLTIARADVAQPETDP